MSVQFIGESPKAKALLELIRKVAGARTGVLIIGESGTGKELVAKLIHEGGPLKTKPFVPVNCGAIPENLIESEMFGHKRGSFTGAVADKPGLFETADGGTLFLDEVGELPLALQVKLLRAIQERTIRRVGGNEDVRVDVRIIAATNRDLESAVAKGTFREDLYYRLNVIQIRVPPLRERREDIPALVTHFLKRSASRMGGRPVVGMTPAALKAMQAHAWPGNIRELENTIERAMALTSGGDVGLELLPSSIAGAISDESGAASATSAGSAIGSTEFLKLPSPDFAKGPVNLDAILAEVEKAYVLAALEHAGGVRKKAAEILGITFRSIRYRLTKLGLGDE